MTTDYVLHDAAPTLHQPVLVVMLSGWIDASGAAAAALSTINDHAEAKLLATFDSDAFIDYRARRPTMELREGVNTRLDWNEIELRVGTDSNGRDVLTLSGPEPDSQWKRFAASACELCISLGTTTMVALGAYPFASPHTRTPRLSSSSPSAEVIAGVPYLKNSVDVPAGMGAVLEHAFTDRGVAALGLWAQVPHYVSAMSYPDASVALLTGLHEVTGISIPTDDLRNEGALQRVRVDQLVAGNAEHSTMVAQLEAAYDQSQQQSLSLGSTDIPSGDELAAEFERFLRDQD